MDEDINLYYFNARFYDATTGRFINVDPIQDGSNWYVYCSNNPLSMVDPTGLEDEIKFKNVEQQITSLTVSPSRKKAGLGILDSLSKFEKISGIFSIHSAVKSSRSLGDILDSTNFISMPFMSDLGKDFLELTTSESWGGGSLIWTKIDYNMTPLKKQPKAVSFSDFPINSGNII